MVRMYRPYRLYGDTKEYPAKAKYGFFQWPSGQVTFGPYRKEPKNLIMTSGFEEKKNEADY